jgi:hypothetical protein
VLILNQNVTANNEYPEYGISDLAASDSRFADLHSVAKEPPISGG